LLKVSVSLAKPESNGTIDNPNRFNTTSLEVR
jgi:hypothetical protein